MEKNDEKRVLRVELNDDVKKVSITGVNGEEKVVMHQELSEDELDNVAGGGESLNHPAPKIKIGCIDVWFPPGWSSQKP